MIPLVLPEPDCMLFFPHPLETTYGVIPTKVPWHLDARNPFVTVTTGVSFLAPENLIS